MRNRFRRRGLRLGLLGLLVCAAMLTLAGPSAAATLTVVTTTDDTVAVDGNCSLREAIQAANTDTAVNECVAGSGADTITFAVNGTITLSSQLPTITDSAGLTIDGSGHSITISGNDASGILSVGTFGSPAPLALTELTLAHGSAGNGGAVFMESGPLTVTDSTFSGNFAFNNGGAINNQAGTVTLTNSTFTGNSAGNNGGAFFGTSSGSLAVTNSTFSGNSATAAPPLGQGNGGAILTTGDATVTNSTISGNSAVSGGGIANRSIGTVTLINTIVASSASGGNCTGTITDGGGNLSWPDTTCPGINANPNLGSLQDNGGPTFTMALGAGSAALDVAVLANCPSTDQRGILRPQGTGCDIGAFEVVVSPPQYQIQGFFSPYPKSKWKAGRTVPVKVALVLNGTRISDAAAAALLSPTCRVKLSATGAQTQPATCMKYDPVNHQFVFNWKLGSASGAETITVTVYNADASENNHLSEPITITSK